MLTTRLFQPTRGPACQAQSTLSIGSKSTADIVLASYKPCSFSSLPQSFPLLRRCRRQAPGRQGATAPAASRSRPGVPVAAPDRPRHPGPPRGARTGRRRRAATRQAPSRSRPRPSPSRYRRICEEEAVGSRICEEEQAGPARIKEQDGSGRIHEKVSGGGGICEERAHNGLRAMATS